MAYICAFEHTIYITALCDDVDGDDDDDDDDDAVCNMCIRMTRFFIFVGLQVISGGGGGCGRQGKVYALRGYF